MSEMLLINEWSRFALVSRWLEWLGASHSVYNVTNTHQCFNEKPRSIVRPFKEENNFYGCLKCGKYHFCFNSHQTCDSIAATMDINNDRPTCAYSGQTIMGVHNEVIGNYNDTIQCQSDVQNGVVFMSSKNAFNTGSSAASAAFDTRRINAMENMVHANSTQKKSPSKKELRNNDKQDLNQYFSRRDELIAAAQPKKVEKVEEEEEEEEETEEEEDEEDKKGFYYEEIEGFPEPEKGEEDEEEEEEEEEESIEPEETTISGVIARNKKRERETNQAEEEKGMNEDVLVYCDMNDIVVDEQDERDEEDPMTYDSGLTRMKNHHNNVAFWDHYYSFLTENTVVPSLTPLVPKSEEDSVNSTTCDYNDDPVEKKRNTLLYDYSSNHASVFKTDPLRWVSDVDLIIENETRRIIDILLRTSMIQEQVIIEDSVYARLVESLTSYYHNIICNVVILIYHSPYMEKLAADKHEAHEKQGRSSDSSKITVSVTDITSLLEQQQQDGGGPANGDTEPIIANPINYQKVYNLVCPKKVCASLMLQLFTDAFYLADTMTNRLYVWVTDPWLTEMKTRIFDDIIMDYNIILDPLNHQKKRHKKSQQYENIFFKKDLTAMSATISTALKAYHRHPMWLSSFIYSFKRQ